MGDNEKQSSGIDKAKQAAEGIKEAKNVATEGAKLAASIASGNAVEAAKSIAKLAKSKMFKKALIRKMLISLSGILAILMIIIIILSVFNSVKDKMIELASSIKTTVTSFWKWFTDDYWIKLNKEIEFETIDEDTRTSLHT